MTIKPIRPAALGLYVHIPWCVKKCPYCDFNSHVAEAALPENDYLEALLEDLRYDLPLIDNRPITTIFFGGGTPSLFSPSFFERFIHNLQTIITLSPTAEITLEANPGTLECAPFHDLRHAGINRISLGLQSLSNTHLTALGRIHTVETGLAALDAALRADFYSVNADLMFGLPQQNLQEAIMELEQLIATGVPHLSWYQLTIEPNTIFFRQTPQMPPEDTLADIAEAGHAVLNSKGFNQYEVSAFALSKHACQHNRNYWEFGDYIGIGAGAHGKLTTNHGHITRTKRTRLPRHYFAHPAEKRRHDECLSTQDHMFEYCLNRLRLFEPISLSQMSQATGTPIKHIVPLLSRAIEYGWISPITHADTHFQTTALGRAFLNDLTSLFLPN